MITHGMQLFSQGLPGTEFLCFQSTHIELNCLYVPQPHKSSCEKPLHFMFKSVSILKSTIQTLLSDHHSCLYWAIINVPI